MKRFKKELSWLLVAALVVSSLAIGFGQLQTSAATQAAGQMATYRFRVKTAGQDCNGTGTANNLTVTINYSDGTSNNSNTIAGEGSPNYFEAGNTDTIVLGPALMAKPISSITFNSAGGDRWKVDWTALDYSWDGGSNWGQIATTGGFDGTGVRTMTYPSTYSLNTSSLNKTLTFNGNGGTVNGATSFQYYSEYGATLPAQTLTMARTGYTFAGWSPAVPTTGPSADTTYTAQWTAITYYIAFNGNGSTGGSTGTMTCLYGTAYNLTANGFSRTGHTFSGWATSAGGGVSYTNGQSVSNLSATNGATVTLYAVWSINSYTISFNGNGGSTPASITQNYGTAVTPPADPTRTGYTFTGWSPAVPSTMPASNTTCVAQWSINSYTVTFDANGGTGGWSQSLNYGATITPPTVTRTGYTFGSWSPTPPGTVPVGGGTYVAQWTINSYTITWDANGGTGGGTTSVNHGVTPTPPTVTRTGYTFVSWSPTIVPATGNTTYTAQWNLNSYTITWDANGGTGGTTTTVNHGTTPTPPTVTKTGNTFTGWSPAIVPATGNTTYTAQWTVNQYTISFDSAGGSAVGSITQNYGTAVTAPANPTRTGYTFTGWTPAVPTTMPASNTNCVAGWSVNSYLITFDANGGTGGTGPTSMQYGAALSAPTVTRTGYTFNYWSPSVPSTVPAADTTYTAQWTINQYTVSFNSNGGSAVSPITQNYNTSVAQPAAPTKTGNTFGGWYTDAGLTNPVSWPYTLGAANVTFYAKWTVNSYNLTFDANGGTGGTGPTATQYGAAISAPTVTRTGYTFTGWSPAVATTMPAADTTYTAQWSIIAYTIYFDEAGGSAVADITQDYGTAVTAPADPTKTGYTFLGWIPAVPAAMPAEDTYCVAQWQLNSYTITWAANGGTGGGTNSCDHGVTPTPVDAGTKEGYTFTGWDPSIVAATGDTTYTAQWSLNSYTITWAANGGTGGGTNSCDHGATPTPVSAGTKEGYTFTGWDPSIVAATGDTTYTAQWSINSYNLTFDANGGTGGTGPTSTEYGAAISAPTVTRTGYTFTGWSPAVATTMPAADTTYTAQWTINSYNLTFDANGGTGGTGPTATEYGAAISAPTVTRTGYTFDGWDPAVAATMPAADTTYTAQWTAATVTITFDANGGTGGWSQDLTIGDPLEAPEVTRSGYSFDGWDPEVPATVPGASATYTAQWVEIELIPADGSTTVVDETDSLIYGLSEGMTQTDFESLFVEILGDGRLEITTLYGEFGTGTKVELINNDTEEVVETYYIVIFGDVTGDGIIGSIDADVIINYENFYVEWDYETEPYWFTAGDLSGDGNVESVDSDIIINYENFYMWIDQTTGLAYAY
jgi:uncharacterized repeat protein (TIGR02543 family)